MHNGSALVAAVVQHSDALFGRRLAPADFAVRPLAAGSRQVFSIQATDPHLPALVAKVRSPRGGEDTDGASTQTDHEFAVHSAVNTAMVAAGIERFVVPRPILALPDEGLLFMAQAHGRPIEHSISREPLGLVRASDTDDRVRRCGEWLHTFACRAPALRLNAASESAERVLARGRVNHHIYSLIGLSGSALVEAMRGQVHRRLLAYQIDSETTAKIESAFSRTFEGFGGSRDLQGNVHGKFSIADVLVSPDQVTAIDLEQAGRGSLYLDAAYFVYQLCMATRWRLFARDRRFMALRATFLTGRSPAGELEEGLLDAFVAYYLVNSLRPGGGIAGLTARARASAWIGRWAARASS